ncbi:hypothetical protein VIAG107301_12680 [Vibrio agarivorans]
MRLTLESFVFCPICSNFSFYKFSDKNIAEKLFFSTWIKCQCINCNSKFYRVSEEGNIEEIRLIILPVISDATWLEIN